MTEVHTIHGGGTSLDDRGEGDRQRRTFKQSEAAMYWRTVAQLMASTPADRINAARQRVETKVLDEMRENERRNQDAAEMAARHRRQWFLLLICLGPVALWAVLYLLADRGYI